MQEAEERNKANPQSCGGFLHDGQLARFPYLEARDARFAGWRFRVGVKHAQPQYRTDTAPEDRNLAPAEFWPSASRFRSLLHAAGKRLGANARADTSRELMIPTSACLHRSS